MPLSRRRTPDAEIGAGVRIAHDARLEVWAGGQIVIGDGCVLGPRTRLVANGGRLEIAPGAVLGRGCTVIAHADVRIGERAHLEEGVVVLDFDHDIADVETPIRRQGLLTGPVRIGAGVRVGLRACVLQGVQIGAGAQIGPHAVVTRDVAPGARAEGIPARVVL